MTSIINYNKKGDENRYLSVHPRKIVFPNSLNLIIMSVSRFSKLLIINFLKVKKILCACTGGIWIIISKIIGKSLPRWICVLASYPNLEPSLFLYQCAFLLSRLLPCISLLRTTKNIKSVKYLNKLHFLINKVLDIK